jgi:hypothetical protein
MACGVPMAYGEKGIPVIPTPDQVEGDVKDKF